MKSYVAPIEIPEDELLTVARTVWGEARNQKAEGQIAVVWVILNRFYGNPKRFGRSLAGVCQKPWQFSCWNDSDPQAEKIRAVDPAKQKKIVRAVLAGSFDDPTGGATHYCNPKGCSPRQRARSGMLAGKCHIKIGAHEFYRPEDLTPAETRIDRIIIRRGEPEKTATA